MKSVSTGVGMCVLSGTIAACFAVSHFGGEERALAFAQNAIETRAQHPLTRATPASRNANLTDCDVRVEHWFSPVPHLIQECGTQPFLQYVIQSNLDLLGDGKPRILFSDPYDNDLASGNLFVYEFQQLPDGTTGQKRVVILSSDDNELINNFLALGLGSGSWDSPNGGGIADMDGDGDLDIVIGCGTGQRVWLENIKGDVVRHSPYDLDRDGHVNTGDLSLMLMEFTD